MAGSQQARGGKTVSANETSEWFRQPNGHKMTNEKLERLCAVTQAADELQKRIKQLTDFIGSCERVSFKRVNIDVGIDYGCPLALGESQVALIRNDVLQLCLRMLRYLQDEFDRLEV